MYRRVNLLASCWYIYFSYPYTWFENILGRPPFYAENVDVLYSNIEKMHFELPEVSNEAKQFILSAMAYEPDSRPDANTLLCHSWLQGEESSIGTLLCFSQFEIPLQEGHGCAQRDSISFLKRILERIFSDVGIYWYSVENCDSVEFLRDTKPVFCRACISSEYYLKFFTLFVSETQERSAPAKVCFKLHRGRSILFLKVVHKLRDLILAAVK